MGAMTVSVKGIVANMSTAVMAKGRHGAAPVATRCLIHDMLPYSKDVKIVGGGITLSKYSHSTFHVVSSVCASLIIAMRHGIMTAVAMIIPPAKARLG